MGGATTGIVLPLFGVLASGYLAARLRVLPQNASAVLGRLVFAVLLPALVFVSLSRVRAAEFFDWPFVGALGGGMAAMMGLAMLVGRFAFRCGPAALGLHGLTAMFSSTAYIGLPVILMVYGEAGLVPGIIGAVITGAVFLPIGIVLAEVDRGRRNGDGGLTLAPLLAVVRNPIIVATATGLAVSAAGLALPAPVRAFCELLGGAFIPCALFSAGLFIAGCSVRGEAREIAWLALAKLAIHPLITAWLAYRVLALEGIRPEIAVLQAALPSGVPVFVLAQEYGVFASRASAVIVVTTAASVVTLPALLLYFGR